jgi:hypothetical protein
MPIQLDLIDFVNRRKAADDAAAVAESPDASQPDKPADAGFAVDVGRAVYSALIMRPVFELEARRFRQSETDDTGTTGMDWTCCGSPLPSLMSSRS